MDVDIVALLSSIRSHHLVPGISKQELPNHFVITLQHSRTASILYPYLFHQCSPSPTYQNILLSCYQVDSPYHHYLKLSASGIRPPYLTPISGINPFKQPRYATKIRLKSMADLHLNPWDRSFSVFHRADLFGWLI